MGHQVTENILKIAFSYFNILFFRNVVKLLKDVLRRQPVEDDMDSSETLDEENYEVEKNMSSTILEVRGWLDNNISSNCSIRHGRGRRMRRFSFIKYLQTGTLGGGPAGRWVGWGGSQSDLPFLSDQHRADLSGQRWLGRSQGWLSERGAGSQGETNFSYDSHW